MNTHAMFTFSTIHLCVATQATCRTNLAVDTALPLEPTISPCQPSACFLLAL